jgi:nucleoside-diphosphate-sugar epimerase
MILVTGAAGYTGRRLVSRLVADGQAVRCLLRSEPQRELFEGMEVEVWVGELAQADSVRGGFENVERIVHLAGMQVASTLIDCINRPLERVVALSSLRRFSTVTSATVGMVMRGEEQLDGSGLPSTILQSSMIFGPGNDRNISRLAAYLRRRSIMPVFGDGTGLQQPVFVHDVVDVTLSALFGSSCGTYQIAGPEPISYDLLVDLVGAAVGTHPVKIHLPARICALALQLAEMIGLRLPIDREQVMRLQEDKSVSIEAAVRDFNFAPLSFEEALGRIYASGSKEMDID